MTDDNDSRASSRSPKLLLTAGVATAIVGAFVVGTLTDGRGGTPPPERGAAPSPVAFQADLPAAESCDDLLATYVERALPLVTARGWGGDVMPLAGDMDARGAAAAAESRTAGKVVRQTNSETGTNVQETGVDEPDTVKTDGTLLVRMRDDQLVVHDVSGDRVTRLGSLDLPGVEDAEILLSGDTVIAIGTDDATGHERGTRVLAISLADPKEPEVTSDVGYDARAVSARQHGGAIRLVLVSGLPELDFVTPTDHRDVDKAQRHNETLVRETTIEDWLPTITADGTAEQLLDCTDVAIPDDELTIDTVSVVGFDAAAPGTVEAIGLAGRTDIAYESADHLYLVASPAAWRNGVCRCAEFGALGGTSYLFDFALDGTTATHVASGEVEGMVADRWSMDEADGVLRVAVGPTSETGDFNSVITLRRAGQELLEIGRLDGLGRGEELKAVRWFDDLAIVVTFRQVDPLYAVDLTRLRKPRLLGKLKIPGFSSYLHPLGSMRLIGVGEGPSGPGGRGWGAQVGLFDVTRIRDVRRLDVAGYGPNSQAVAGDDPRAFTWLPDERTALTVISRWQRGSRVGWVSVLRLDQGRLHEHRVQVEYGDDVDLVRTVPLPDGRVVLVTGEDARFFPLAAG